MSRARRSTSPSKEGLSAPARGSWTDELPRRLWVDKAGAMAYLSIGEKLLDELRAAGADPLTVSRRLGHSSVAFTLEVYGHVMPDMEQRAVDIMERLLAGV